MKSVVLVLTVLVAACASGRDRPEGDDDIDAPAVDIDAPDLDAPDVDAPIDAAAIDGPIDAPAIDGPIDAPIDAPMPVAPAVALLLTEVSLAPNGGEMIEIFNPTGAAVDLGPYYLSDVPSYFRLPASGQTVDNADFIVRFPAGATIAPGAVVVVALDTAANFMTATGVAPTYSIAGGTMVEIMVTGAATLTNTGEPVILFHYDGAADRVTDVDIMVAGVPTAGNALINKSGIAVDGPDADTVATAYATDAMTLAAQPSAPGSALSTKRLARESAATEAQSGGNGPGGQDETSEQTGTTWDVAPFTALTPGTVPAALQP